MVAALPLTSSKVYPTAVQSSIATHDSELSRLLAGSGAACRRRGCSCHRSIIGPTWAWLSMYSQTATQTASVGHETLLRAAPAAPSGAGGVCDGQLEPFRASPWVSPTAMQAREAVHDRLLSLYVGVTIAAHAVVSHRRASCPFG